MSLKKQVTKGVKWTTASSIVLAIVAILKISVLARFLDKADFGLMALVTFVMSFMELFNDMGLSSAILHKQDITKKQYASLYWINWCVSLLLFGLLYLLTPYVASFYEQPLLNTLIPLIGINLLLSGLGRQFKTIQQKKMLFNLIGIIEIVGACFSLIIAIFLAIKGYGVFSLVYSLIFQSLFTNISFFIIGIKQQGLIFHFKFIEIQSFIKIGIYQVGGQIINYFNRDLDILLIGKLFSADALGGYSLAKQLVFRPAQLINPILVKVATPTLALFQKDINELKKAYLRLINIVASINIPIYFGVIIFASFIVQVLYGTGFENIVIIVRILSVYMIFRSLGNPIGSLVVATGRTDLEFVWNVIVLLITPLFIYLGSRFSIVGVTIGVTLSMIILYLPAWRLLVFKLTRASFLEYFKACFKMNFNFLGLLKNKFN
ncbi:MOP flippase family protein [Polaribacter cellanae]|uniref:MOP flippase family protein n=1 Tax=Polaribacter cellanae TaxID=2818493 RepID=A0A975H6K1_9FLAO|nr:MOP flippase family protein [Polaribacter cellanae]QTE22517.1 MOP flippase family protein [Polaribacter cellanae]